MASSYKKMFDDIASGKPAVVVSKDLYNETTGEPNWDKFDNNIKNTGIILVQPHHAEKHLSHLLPNLA